MLLLTLVLTPFLQSYTAGFAYRFEIEDLTSDHMTEQSGAESNTGFFSARAVQEAIQAGASCIGRTNTAEIACG